MPTTNISDSFSTNWEAEAASTIQCYRLLVQFPVYAWQAG
jgi:hypothetical protein